MDLYKLKFDGIYDLRTLKQLKAEGIDHFNFDFNPRSLNFIPERVFLNLFDTCINETDKIFLHFTSNKDFMVIKTAEEILKRRGNLHNIFYEFDDFFTDTNLPDGLKYFILYSPSIFLVSNYPDGLCGFTFAHNLISKIEKESNLAHFYGNFFTHFGNNDIDSKQFLLKLGIDEIVNNRCLDLFDFNIISFCLNSNVEVCYRNIDLVKLKSKIETQRKYLKAQPQL